jgi:DNA polymerase-3 subunit gamma/tau
VTFGPSADVPENEEAKDMEAQYTVLARRFRPQTFGEVVGQDRISQTLRNAILEGRVAHAYIFSGARGVGKTSMARIFAKALNCPHAVGAVPCNDCEQCLGISAGHDVDVSEIDGASNRGIDDIRSLRASVGVKSMRSKYKVYIIDEVHMLTKEAFNALLKTLEEPPPLVKFLFCTTEPNKVPDTILSRCQRFDFGTICVDDISLRLSQLAEAEGFSVDSEAFELVARRAAGSMRDSQSLFDQLLAFGSKRITVGDVHRLLGTAPDERLIEIVDALIVRDRSLALGRLDAALREGVQLEALTDQLVGYFRDLMVTACGATDAVFLSIGTDQRTRLAEQANQWGLQTIVAGMQVLAESKGRMQRVTYGRALAELALVRISMLEDLDHLDELIAALKAGQSPAVITRASSVPAMPRPSNRETPPDQKKNDFELMADKTNSPPLLSDRHSPVVPVDSIPKPTIEWKAGCENELQSAIISRLTDMTGTYLARVAATAIIGPNILEFSFPLNYDSDRKSCDRPEVVARLEAVVSELVGRLTKVSFRTLPNSVGAKPDAPRQTLSAGAVPVVSPKNGEGFVKRPDDPYLQDIMSLFRVKSWKVQTLAAEVGRTGDCSETPQE